MLFEELGEAIKDVGKIPARVFLPNFKIALPIKGLVENQQIGSRLCKSTWIMQADDTTLDRVACGLSALKESTVRAIMADIERAAWKGQLHSEWELTRLKLELARRLSKES